ncbi:hypothetical protein ABAC460_08770 [Asticcacaulis sp. AC460]|uniref:cytochrome P450 n=1 Tax=Asticcacaulis sp. AC460 TaxID=1282360 RepID=UPI0003C3AC75|nr:cytochrome P450 [Asticcacaulis sp. AC460]ESQ90570.1 hypothetical protein ABAC460_08770 [Asticcacaulis sp. AC460]
MALIHPPAHKVHARPLPKWRWLPQFFINPLSIYSDSAFETLYARSEAFGVRTLSINDPAGIKHVLLDNMANYERPVVLARLFRPAMGQGVFLAEGTEWRRQRRMLAPLFSPAAINDLIPHFQTAGEQMLSRLGQGGDVRLSEVFHRAALDAVLKALFSLKAEGHHADIPVMVRDYLGGAGRPNPMDGMARTEDDFGWAMESRKSFSRKWTAMVDSVITERRAAGPDQAHARGDLLDLLLAARDPQTGEGLSDAEIRDQCSTMLAAGFETTSRMLFWASYLLSLDPAEQGRLREEVVAFAPGRVTKMDDLAHWPRLRNVLLEALRFYPPAAYITRRAMGEDEIGGHRISAGTEVWISPFVLHRHRKFWDHPTAFMPDRFAGVNAPWATIPAYLPFGAGPRICIGASFALVEGQILLAHLLSRFTIAAVDDQPVLPVFRVTTVPGRDPMFRLQAT